MMWNNVLRFLTFFGTLHFSHSLVVNSCSNSWAFDSPELHFGPTTFRVEDGTVVDAGSDLCSVPKGKDPILSGEVLLAPVGGCSLETKARSAQQLGASSLIVSRERPGPAGDEALEQDGSRTGDILIPVVVLARDDGWFLRHFFDDDSTTCTITDGDPNPWVDMRTSWLHIALFQGVCGSYAAYLVLMSVYRIDYYLRRGPSVPKRIFSRATLTPKLVCALLVGLANLERFIFYAVDPFLSRGVFTVLENHLLFTLSIPFSLATTALVTYELIKCSEQTNKRLGGGRLGGRGGGGGGEAARAKRPLQLCVACALAVELVASSLLGLQLDATLGQVLLTIKAVTYLLLTVGLGSVFFIKCAHMRRDLRFHRSVIVGASAKNGGNSGDVDWLDKACRRMTFWGSVTAGCMLGFALCCFTVPTTLFHRPHSQLVVLLLGSLFNFTTSLGHLRFFPGTRNSRGRGRSDMGTRSSRGRSGRGKKEDSSTSSSNQPSNLSNNNNNNNNNSTSNDDLSSRPNHNEGNSDSGSTGTSSSNNSSNNVPITSPNTKLLSSANSSRRNSGVSFCSSRRGSGLSNIGDGTVSGMTDSAVKEGEAKSRSNSTIEQVYSYYAPGHSVTSTRLK